MLFTALLRYHSDPGEDLSHGTLMDKEPLARTQQEALPATTYDAFLGGFSLQDLKRFGELLVNLNGGLHRRRGG